MELLYRQQMCPYLCENEPDVLKTHHTHFTNLQIARQYKILIKLSES